MMNSYMKTKAFVVFNSKRYIRIRENEPDTAIKFKIKKMKSFKSKL